ncbi:MAG: DUF72 domain-containing protein [Acidobacteriia bacterium]|nr:DUF72 domain-containing protein [Terriglobia bacterium]
MLSPIRTGVAGWDFPGWQGIVYPHPAPRGFHPLEFLARRVDTVEISSSFYQFVRPELSRLWLTKVERNPQFEFTARLHREFTHERNLEPALLARFKAAMMPLHEAGRLGCVLMQFPGSFRFTPENKAFLIQLRRNLSKFPLVAELRHDSWTSQEGMGTLIDYHVGFANLDQPGGHRATRASSRLTTGIGYVKLHGRRCGAGFTAFDDRSIQESGNDYLYHPGELADWKLRIERVSGFAEKTFVIFNNDGGGKSLINALQMEAILGHQQNAAGAGMRQGSSEPDRQPRLAVRSAA